MSAVTGSLSAASGRSEGPAAAPTIRPHLLDGTIAIPDGIVPEYCVTCSDEGRLGLVVTMPVPPAAFLPAIVRTEEGLEDVDVTLVPGVGAGDYVLIHAGGAIAVVADPTPEQKEALR